MRTVLHSQTSSKQLSEPHLDAINDNEKQVPSAIAADEDNSNKTSCCTCLDEGGDDDYISSIDCCTIWFVLPPILFLQCGMAFAVDNPATSAISWLVVNWLYAVTSHFFRRSLRDLGIKNDLIALFPLIMVAVILLLILLLHVVMAYLVLLGTMLCMDLIVVFGNLYLLYTGYFHEKDYVDRDKGNEYEIIHEGGDDKVAFVAAKGQADV